MSSRSSGPDVIDCAWLGAVSYEEAWARQHARREACRAGAAPEALWALEHPAVITTGKRAVHDLDRASIRAAGFELHATERGGFATCHEPGQLVVYALLDVRPTGVRRLVAALEEGVMDWLAGEGIAAHRRDGAPGVWWEESKLCAVGLHVAQGYSMHGLALNLVNDLRGFGLITPCGLVGTRVGRVCDFVGTEGGDGAARWAPERVAPSVLASVRDAVLRARCVGNAGAAG